jgi:acetylglutamate kinase
MVGTQAAKLHIVKIGGKLMDDPRMLDTLLDYFSRLPAPKILVHGGGKHADTLLKKLGIAPNMVDGRRITDKETLEVVQMVYAGLINKNLVAALQARGCPAIGLSGADGDIIRAHKRPAGKIDYGFVGDIDKVNVPRLEEMLEDGLCPVFCALTHDGNGQMLNTNADTVATAIAAAMAGRFRTRLYFCFEKSGVLREAGDESTLIPELNYSQFQQLLAGGSIADGMIPKLTNAFSAIEQGVYDIRIGRPDGLAPGGKATRLMNG